MNRRTVRLSVESLDGRISLSGLGAVTSAPTVTAVPHQVSTITIAPQSSPGFVATPNPVSRVPISLGSFPSGRGVTLNPQPAPPVNPSQEISPSGPAWEPDPNNPVYGI